MDLSTELIVKYEGLLTQARFDAWINNIVFTPKWWILLGVLVIPWFIWSALADKTRLVAILIFGFLMLHIILAVDEIGSELTLWTYPISIVPIFPRLIPISYSIVPTFYMLLYQYFPNWKHFIIANIITSVTLTLILQPLSVKLGFLILLNWNHTFSTLICITAGLISKWFVDKITAIEHKTIA